MEMQDHKQSDRIFSPITRFLRNLKTDDSDHNDDRIDISALPHKSDKPVVFMKNMNWEPTPEAYLLSWEYFYGTSYQLKQALDEILKNKGKPSFSLARELVSEYLEGWSHNELLGMISIGKDALHTGKKIIRQSRDDNRDYSLALEQEIEEIEASVNLAGSPVKALLNLTQAIVSKSIEAERQLKDAETNLVAMRQKLAQVTQKAETDQLTGLPNRWAFNEYLKNAVLRSRELIEPLSVAFVDIDNFKRINDQHGHDAGDRVLKKLAQILDKMSDNRCHVARHGGEEFVLLFQGKDAQAVFDILEPMRVALSQKDFTNMQTGKQIGTITFSAGIAMLNSDGDSGAMLRKADTALYVAKENGRNQIQIHES